MQSRGVGRGPGGHSLNLGVRTKIVLDLGKIFKPLISVPLAQELDIFDTLTLPMFDDCW